MNKLKDNPIAIVKIIVAFIAVVAVIFTIINLLRNAQINILVSPAENATVTINGRNYKNGNYKTFPKDHAKIIVSAPDFETQEFELDIKAYSTTPIHISLRKAENSAAYYIQHKQDYDILLLNAKDEASINLVNEINQKATITDLLSLKEMRKMSDAEILKHKTPYQETIIRDASANPDCKALVCLGIFDTLKQYDKGKELIKTAGFNPDDYQIIEMEK